ncbi:MAG: exodeoxyribonuclease VII large subunit, partial [Desulfocapsaceae bacterium]|nr:exodeoxyribonuclease VII large subunit [Desulfocapsaceae bacterium]
RLSVYEVRGEYQIIVDTVDFAGAGNLQLEFEKLKRKLAEEGLFGRESKKSIPAFPEHIVVITSATGAAIRDFLKVATQRKYWGKIDIFPVAVQGNKSAEEISQAIDTICQSIDADLLILLRGGGSLEDLWSFNEEITARAIYQATIPIVTGIGHDTDYTIADMCADLHTHTPTAAAEAVIADSRVLREDLCEYKHSLIRSIGKRVSDHEEAIMALRRIMGNLDLYLANFTLRLDYKISALVSALQNFITSSTIKIDGFRKRLEFNAPLTGIRFQELELAHRRTKLIDAFQQLLHQYERRLAGQAALLDSVSPLSVLARGYSIVSRTDKDSQKKEIILKEVQVEKGEKIDVQLHQGRLKCQVIDKQSESPWGKER